MTEPLTLLDQSFPAEPERLCEIRRQVSELTAQQGLKPDEAAEVALATSEAIANIIAHGYHGESGHSIHLEVIRESQSLVIIIDDDAPCIHPEQIAPRPLDELRPGGLGVHFMRALMNEVTYEPREGGGNRLRMAREL